MKIFSANLKRAANLNNAVIHNRRTILNINS